MSVTFLWDNREKTQLRFVFEEMWQIDDLKQVIQVSINLIASRNQIVDMIMDMSECNSMPSNLSLMRNHLKQLNRDHIGVMVFVTSNIYLQRVMQLLNQLMRQHFVMYFTDTLSNAHRIVNRATTTRQNHMVS